VAQACDLAAARSLDPRVAPAGAGEIVTVASVDELPGKVHTIGRVRPTGAVEKLVVGPTNK